MSKRPKVVPIHNAHKTLVTQMMERDQRERELKAKAIARHQHVVKATYIEGLKLLVMLWSHSTTKSDWLTANNAIWQAQRVAEQLKLEELSALMTEMAHLAEIRAEMEEI
jgi:hypothetical protein